MKSIFSPAKRASTNGQIRSSRDWFILMGISLLLLVLSTLYNLWLIARVTSGQSFGTQTTTTPIPDVSTKSVDAMFAARAASQDTYAHSYHAVDPSTVSR